MAKRSYGFKNRFPFAGLFFIIAISIAIPLTVWSLNNVSTILTQKAQTPRCGANNQNPSCPKDFTCKYLSNNPLLGGSCTLESLNAPVNFKAEGTCKYNKDNPNDATVTLTWDKMDNATEYLIYGNYYYMSMEKLTNVSINPYSTDNNLFIITLPVPKEVKHIYWQIKAVNSVFKVTGLPSELLKVKLDCN